MPDTDATGVNARSPARSAISPRRRCRSRPRSRSRSSSRAAAAPTRPVEMPVRTRTSAARHPSAVPATDRVAEESDGRLRDRGARRGRQAAWRVGPRIRAGARGHGIHLVPGPSAGIATNTATHDVLIVDGTIESPPTSAGACSACAALGLLPPHHHRQGERRRHQLSLQSRAGRRARRATGPTRPRSRADKPSYAAGETAHVEHQARPADGKALVVVAGDKRSLAGGRRTGRGRAGRYPVSADWGAGAYVLVTHYRAAQRRRRDASRCARSALTWLGVDQRRAR